MDLSFGAMSIEDWISRQSRFLYMSRSLSLLDASYRHAQVAILPVAITPEVDYLIPEGRATLLIASLPRLDIIAV